MSTLMNIKKRMDPDFKYFCECQEISLEIILREIISLLKIEKIPKFPDNNRGFLISPDTKVGRTIIMLVEKHNKQIYHRISKCNDTQHHILKLYYYDSNEGNTEKVNQCVYCSSNDIYCLMCNGVSDDSEQQMLYCSQDPFCREIHPSEFILMKDIYLYYSQMCENVYIEYTSIMPLVRNMFDTLEKKWKRLKYLYLLHKRFPEHSIFGNFDFIQIFLHYLE